MNYTQALEYLDTFVNIERSQQTRATRAVITLDRVREIARRLGNPERRFRSLHVAGTKGKGSTCAFLASILRAAGLKTGLYVSPHLQDLRERISIDGRQISPEDFARIMTQCSPVLEEMRVPPKGERRPTYFEVLTHLAFTWFAEQNVDAAVIEVGLGGRLDATNIITPEVCGISHISYDHTAILGETLDLIAREKAGIMKPGVPVVIAPQVQEAEDALRECARRMEAPVTWVDSDLRLECISDGGVSSLPRARVSWTDCRVCEATLGLRGSFQCQNWGLAVGMAEEFYRRVRGSALPLPAIVRGSREVSWPGRMEFIEATAKPRVILDGAHNDHSVSTVLNEVLRDPGVRKPVVVLFACAKDKNSRAMLQVLSRADARVIFTTSGSTRSRDPQELAVEWREVSKSDATCEMDLAKAFALAQHEATESGTVLVIGSLYLVGAMKDLCGAKL
ncbi:MAG TPA: folylpolyglutamate synthase/dihydrofolate synthase family protein [Planctomycetota bacterium]|nr:folylpolyglutamate synthase/dihydrofolate synthase family protein [Planctomycetota bacterium]